LPAINFQLPPLLATALFILAVIAGHRFRKEWKKEKVSWARWLYGCTAAICLLVVAFIPLDLS